MGENDGHPKKKVGVDWRDRRVVEELYMREEAVIRIGGENYKPCVIGRGVRAEARVLTFTSFVCGICRKHDDRCL